MNMHTAIPHESARLHVSGEAVYVDDMLATEQLLVGRVVYSPHAHARITSFDLSDAKNVPGVHAVISFRDIPGHNQMGPVVSDELCLAEDEVTFIGQAMFLIAAETEEQCREAERKIHVTFEPLEAITTIEQAIANDTLLGPPAKIERGDVNGEMKKAPFTLKGTLLTGAQEHWYLETQASLCVPGEGREMTVYASSQNPSETQALVAEVLGVNKNEVVVDVRRMGGGFGGKETQGNHVACWSAILSHATRRPVKVRLFRDDDQKMTGKRHRFLSNYEAGFDADGKLLSVDIELNCDGGGATDLTFAILQRAMLHSDNAYFVPNIRIIGKAYKTNLPSNTAFRGFGGPQGMAVIETIIDRIARTLKKDAAEIRFKNFYGTEADNITPYGQVLEGNRLFTLYEQLTASAEYAKRRKDIQAFNADNEFYKKGLALTPVKFGISFTATFLNQAGALVNIYKDGTILVNHGGTEMGQGLHTKMQQVAAHEFSVPVHTVKVNATNTSKVPNTSATAASSGADLNGMAVKNACEILKDRIAEALAAHFTEQFHSPTFQSSIRFRDGMIFDTQHQERTISFADAMPLMVLRQVSLSAQGFYKTPGIGWDPVKGFGKPFFYFAYGMSVSEVLIDVLTGEHTVLRTDILHDVGNSLNQAIDQGQVEGGFIQGMGWCTTEEIKWDGKGNLLTHSPDTYKIPAVRNVPRDFRVTLLDGLPNTAPTIGQSKAVGEPPFMLAFSVWMAIKDAISAVGNHETEPDYTLPATNEVILLSAEKLKRS